MAHKTQEQLNKLLQKAKEQIEVGKEYYHYKNPQQRYVIEAVGFIEETETACVVYRALYGDEIVWVRTVENFCEVADKKKRIKRFSKV